MQRLERVLGHLAAPVESNSPTFSPHATSNAHSLQKPFPPLSTQFPALASKLASLFPDGRYSEDAQVLQKHGREVIGYASSFPPQCVIFPTSTREVSELCRLCNNHTPPIPITAYSGGTSLESHIIPINGGVCLSFAKMDKILKIYEEDMQVVVQPGLNWSHLNKQLAQLSQKKPNPQTSSTRSGNDASSTPSSSTASSTPSASSSSRLFLGVDPAPAACIGGMCGTSCSGPLALKYGTMRQQVVNMTVVLADGTVFKTGQRGKKSVAGYDLNSFFIGSEGTLGVVTEVTLKLQVFPKVVEIGQAIFDDIESIAKCITEINQTGMTHSNLMSFEYLDDVMVECSNKFGGGKKELFASGKHILLFQFAGPSAEHVKCDIELIGRVVEKFTSGRPFVFSQDEKSREKLWRIRKNAFYASKFARTGYDALVTDVATPVSNFSECLVRVKKKVEEISSRSNVIAPIVGHVGDANFHCCVMFDKNDLKHVQIVQELSDFIVKTALQLDGTCTAEHGVGVHKKKYLEQEFGKPAVEVMKRVKRMFDKNNILNPGKVVDI